MKRISMQRKSTVSLDEAFEFFIRKCKVKNLTDVSIRSYEDKVLPFKKFYGDRPLDEISSSTIDEYILWLQETRGNAITINSYLRSVKAFLYYCMSCGYVPTFKIHLIKAEKTIKPTYTEEELKRLLKKPDVKNCKFSEFRNWVMVNYLLGTGQRRNTVTNIKIKDLDLENALVRLNVTKNKKATILPITKSLVDILEEYLDFRGGSPDDYLFCNESGKKLSNESCTNSIRKYNLRRGVEKTSIHVFRHTFAYMSIKNNIDIVRLQQLLCHSNIKTTQGYLRSFGFEDLRENYEMFNPLENFMNKNPVAKNFKERQK